MAVTCDFDRAATPTPSSSIEAALWRVQVGGEAAGGAGGAGEADTGLQPMQRTASLLLEPEGGRGSQSKCKWPTVTVTVAELSSAIIYDSR
jgi:hypothetical protein